MGKPVTIHHSITIGTISFGRSNRAAAIEPYSIVRLQHDGWLELAWHPLLHAITGLPAISGRD
jgi:hypothetical protein